MVDLSDFRSVDLLVVLTVEKKVAMKVDWLAAYWVEMMVEMLVEMSAVRWVVMMADLSDTRSVDLLVARTVGW